MKSLKNVFGVLMILLFLISCGGETKKEELKASNTKLEVTQLMNGALSSNFEIVNSSLNIAASAYGHKLLVEIKRTDKDFTFDVNDVQYCGVGAGKSNEYCINADIMDVSGSPIVTNLGKYGTKPFEQCLSLNEGETIWLEFMIYDKGLIVDPSKAKTVRLTSSLKENVVSKVASNSSNSTPVVSSSTEWDEVLDEYEDYTKKYVSVYRKAMDGDPSALGEYPALMEKATKFSNKLQTSSDDLTTKQMVRMNKIQMLMLDAVQ